MTATTDAADAVARLTGYRPATTRPLGGGDTGQSFRVELADGSAVFAKTVTRNMPGAVRAEAASLSWLADAGTVPVPEVLGHDDDWLVLEEVRPARASAAAAEEFGRGLARLHATGAPGHGCPPPGGPLDAWIGLAPMHNLADGEQEWPAFFAAERVEPYLRRAQNAGTLRGDDVAVVEQVCSRLPELAGPPEPPSRLHGDLWTGNVLWADNGSGTAAWLIDPAAHGGHRESDLAMLQLFGCPHLERVLSAYQEVHPLAAGWRDRVGLHQLFPLLVHAVLFGGGYAAHAVDAARSTLRAG